MAPTVKDYDAAAEKAEQWAAGGEEALGLAARVEAANLGGEVVPASEENVKITVKASIKMFLDGYVADKNVKDSLAACGLDMNDVRRSLTEQVLARAIPNMIVEGDLAGLISLAKVAGEDIGQNGSSAPSVVVQVATASQVQAVDSHIEQVIGTNVKTGTK